MIRRNQILEIDVDEHSGLRSGATFMKVPTQTEALRFFEPRKIVRVIQQPANERTPT